MERNEFHFNWERDRKFELREQLEREYVESVWQEAISLHEEALAEQPDNPEYLHGYGFLLELKANRLLRKAAECYETGLNGSPVKGDYSWIAGKLHEQLIKVRGQLSENRKSIDFYKKRLDEFPNEADSYRYLAKCYLTANQPREAQLVLLAGLKLFPTDAMLHYYQGETLARLGQIEEALLAWERSAQLDSQLIDGRFSRALVLERENRLAEAIAEWERIADFMDRYEFDAEVPRREIERLKSKKG